MSNETSRDDDAVVKPQVIDLEAEEVKVEGEDSSQVHDAPPRTELPPHKQAPPRKQRGSMIWVAVAAIIGLAAGGWLYRDVLSTYLPTDEMTALRSRIEVLEANGRTLGEQLQAVSQSSDAAAQATAGVEQTIREVSSGVADTRARIEAFEGRVAAAEQAVQAANSDLDALRAAVSSGAGAGQGAGPVDSAALAAIGQRIEALEKDVASLKSRGSAGEASGATAALSQSLADLKAKIAAGAAFQGEYDRIARMVPAAAGLEVLSVHAATGLPAASGLAAELRAAIPDLPQPDPPAPPAESSYWDSIWSALSGIITIRDIGETDWPRLAETAAAAAESGDLAQSIALIDTAEGSAPAALLQWRDRAAARIRLEGALDTVSQAVLRQIAAIGGAQ